MESEGGGMNKERFKIIGPDGKERTLFDISGKSIVTQLPEEVKVPKIIPLSEEVTFTLEAGVMEELKKALGVDDESLRRIETDMILKFVQILGEYCNARSCAYCPFYKNTLCMLTNYEPSEWCGNSFEEELREKGFKFPGKILKITWGDKE